MKNIAIVLIISIFLLVHGAAFGQTNVIPLVTAEWEPYTSQSIAGPAVFTQIVTTVFREAGMEPRYTYYSWKRAEILTKKGQMFAVFPYRITGERTKSFYFSEPVMISTGRFFYLKENFPRGITYKLFEDLAPFIIGGVWGYWYEKPFSDARLKVEYVTTDTQNIIKLHKNRIQLAACEELVGWRLIQKLYPQEVSRFATLDKPLNRDELRLMISKNYPKADEITKAFNVALVRLKKQGKIREILAQHGMQ